MKIAIQGEPASYHHIAARAVFGDKIEIFPCETFKEVFDSLQKSKVDDALVAIENSLFGSINEVYDLLIKYKFWISGEYYLRIQHALIGAPGARIDKITEVHSHPVALAQCEKFLDTTLSRAERFESHDTAGSVAELSKRKNPNQAAIASTEAAAIYGMEVLKNGIETNKQNYTRFIALERQESSPKLANKTSVVMDAANKPGSLYRALGVFAEKDMNLSKLESRPIIGKAWHYMFYIDFEAGLEEERTKSALKILDEMGNSVTVLGSYPKHSL